ncbi:Rhizopuspepsinogen [Aphelenchoides besseyi]|nr:Rhizopuspepsinogen [Aphelenchoides besseyi]
MSTMLIVSLLIATTLVTFVDAGSWKLSIRKVKRVQRNNTLGPLHDIYREVLNLDRFYYRGSSILWIPRKGCKATGWFEMLNKQPFFPSRNCETGKYVYNPEESASSLNLTLPFSIIYGGGKSLMQGHYFKDFFSFGEDMRITAAVSFGVAETIVGEDQGVLGLGNAIDPNERGSSIIHEAWRQKVIDAPIFTIYLRKCPDSEDCEKYGTITIGSYDTEMCNKVVGRVKVNPNLSGVRLANARISKPFNAMTDSGAAGIYVPSNIFEQLVVILRATLANGDRYIVKCDADAALALRINGYEYEIPANQLLVNLHNDYCLLLIYRYDSHDNRWLLGTPFLRYANSYVVEN